MSEREDGKLIKTGFSGIRKENGDIFRIGF